MEWLGFALVGLLAGGLSGLLGIGGGILMIPAMIYFFGYSQHEAQGTTLAVLVPPIGLFAAMQYYRQGYVHIKPAMIIAISFAVAAYFVSGHIRNIPEIWLKRCFGLIMAFVAGQMLLSGFAGPGSRLAAIAGGAVAALLGGAIKLSTGEPKARKSKTSHIKD